MGDQQMPIQIACDRKLVLTWVQSERPIQPTKLHADLLLVVKSLTHMSRYTIKWHHVCGHQDDYTITVLTQDTWLNIEADGLAENKLDPKWCGPNNYQIPQWMLDMFNQEVMDHQTIDRTDWNLLMAFWWKSIGRKNFRSLTSCDQPLTGRVGEGVLGNQQRWLASGLPNIPCLFLAWKEYEMVAVPISCRLSKLWSWDGGQISCYLMSTGVSHKGMESSNKEA